MFSFKKTFLSKKQPKSAVTLFSRLKQGLSRTRGTITGGLSSLILGKKTINDDLLEEVENLLLTADVGVEATQTIIADLTQKAKSQQLTDVKDLLDALKADLQAIIAPCEQALKIEHHQPYVILMTGINGAGKTTTIGKLTKHLQKQGKSVMLAAGDTFRAAAIEQLMSWGKQNDVPVVAQHDGADSASVIFDAFQSAQARHIDVLIADTAGRLHTQSNLMQELKKIKRVISKLDDCAPHEVMLVLDAGTGQNALNQAKEFNTALGITGITLTKLDGTAKGGIIFAIAKQLNIPIRFIGIGEKVDDLREFNASEFIDALFDTEPAEADTQ